MQGVPGSNPGGSTNVGFNQHDGQKTQLMWVLTNIMVKLGYDGIGRRASDGNVYHGAECRDAPRNKVMMIYGFESRYPNKS